MRASQSRPVAMVCAYAVMVLGAIAVFLFIRNHGETLSAPPRLPISASAPRLEGPVPALTEAGPAARQMPLGFGPTAVWHLALALTVVALTGRLLGYLFRYIGQPPVIGEVTAGILLRPSLLGRLAPEIYLYILPPTIVPLLGFVAQLGVVLYMFFVGLDLNPDLLRHRVGTAIATSHASVVLPFLLGAALALYLYPRFSTSDVSFTNFALFLGVAMSITAFPVLARILSDRGMTRTDLGTMALTCAAADDVTAWCLLAFVVGVARKTTESVLPVPVWTLIFILVMFVGMRPIAERLTRLRRPTLPAIAVTLIALLIAASTTEAIGIKAIFGAFLFGVIIPHDSALAAALNRRFKNLVTILLLPAFFAFTGMRTQIALVANAYDWAICGLIVAVATIGKLGGTVVAARSTGQSWRYAVGLGVLMNTRGLMELIVLNVGLDLGVISPVLFTMLVIMALVTTFATTPMLDVLRLGRQQSVAAYAAR